MSKKTNTLLASAVAAGILMMGAQGASAAGKAAAADKSSAAGAIEQRLKMMEDQMNAMRSELGRVRAESASSAKVNELEAKVAKQAVATGKGEHRNLLFFRGGYAKMEKARDGELLAGQNSVVATTAGFGDPTNGDGDGWYTGAGFDFHLTEDVWGLTDKAEVFGELMFEYKNFGTSYNSLISDVDNVATSALVGSNVDAWGTVKNKLTQFTLTASPKIKFNPHGDFRPWVIPVGLAIHVISPPSSGVTVLNPGLMLGAGAEYKIWKDIYAGADFRYHFTGDDLDISTKNGALGKLKGTNTDGYTTGAYLGVGF